MFTRRHLLAFSYERTLSDSPGRRFLADNDACLRRSGPAFHERQKPGIDSDSGFDSVFVFSCCLFTLSVRVANACAIIVLNLAPFPAADHSADETRSQHVRKARQNFSCCRSPVTWPCLPRRSRCTCRSFTKGCRETRESSPSRAD